jgi:hypothetical protein
MDTATISTNPSAVELRDQQRRRVRRTALVLSLIAAGFYIAFIVMSVSKAIR